MDSTHILRLDETPAVDFAARELRRYLNVATGLSLRTAFRKQFQPGRDHVVWLGTKEHFGQILSGTLVDNARNDAYLIRIVNGAGIIVGSNPRSVLLGAYRFLAELGFRWVRPGKDGERIPDLRDRPLPEVNIHEQAAYRHRGICIEGAVSYEHVRDMVAWLPKLGFNAYFIQFREAYNFFQRWYEHEGNPRYRKRPFPLEKARELTRKVRAEVAKRELDLHMVGHGWTCEPFGIPGTGWFQHEGPIPPATVPHLAEVKGKRALWGGMALNANLCYGKPETREIIVQAIVEYAGQSADVNILHFWLADGSNNHCECPHCRNIRPADLYVKMLNDVDRKLSQQGIPTRIVFLIYVDLLWPPEHERIHNPDRFILMFAPITRSYSRPFAAEATSAPALPPFQRNKLEFPRDPQQNLAFLQQWRTIFPGDSFDFDYHFMWDHFKDPAQYAMAGVLHQDIQRLRDIGLNGFVSCQVQRAFFPTGLGMTVLGQTLWDRERDFDTIARDYFEAAFGQRGQDVQKYLSNLSDLFNPRLLRGEASPAERAKAPGQLAEIPGVIADFQPVIGQGTALPDPCLARSWHYLAAHGEICVRLSRALQARFLEQDEQARALAWELFTWVRHHERDLHPVFDVYEFQLTMGPILGLRRDELTQKT